MRGKKFVGLVIVFSVVVIGVIGVINYVIDPYGIYNHKLTDFKKVRQGNKMKLVKALKIETIRPKSISLGTSRTEYGYDPTHAYFVQPAYNLATSGASLYENRLYFEKALKEGELKKVLLVADWIMFNTMQMTKTADFEDYFKTTNARYLISTDMLLDSFWTIAGRKNGNTLYLQTGQRDGKNHFRHIEERGGHMAVMNEDEERYYKRSDYKTNHNIYQDTGKNAFDDFAAIIALCYENNLELDIIFGPSHIRQWEAFDYYHGYDTWLQWKKDVVMFVAKKAKEHDKKPFRVMDFSVYHPLTAESVPADKNQPMQYHWEGSHYKHELGLIVLDRLSGKEVYPDFGVELDSETIDNHLENLKSDRKSYIDTKAYRNMVFGKTDYRQQLH
jgi:hypothetical protein